MLFCGFIIHEDVDIRGKLFSYEAGLGRFGFVLLIVLLGFDVRVAVVALVAQTAYQKTFYLRIRDILLVRVVEGSLRLFHLLLYRSIHIKCFNYFIIILKAKLVAQKNKLLGQ